MIKRLKTGTGVLAGLAALALGGSAIAGATSSTTPKQHPATESTSAHDGDNVQSGDQTTPDGPPASKAEAPSSETAGESAGANDGPGGHADPVGAQADTQQQGEH